MIPIYEDRFTAMKKPTGTTEKIRRFVSANFPLARRRSISDTDPLLEGGMIDSLGVLDTVSFLEQEFGISISDEELVPEHFRSISALAEFVQAKLNGPSAS